MLFTITFSSPNSTIENIQLLKLFASKPNSSSIIEISNVFILLTLSSLTSVNSTTSPPLNSTSCKSLIGFIFIVVVAVELFGVGDVVSSTFIKKSVLICDNILTSLTCKFISTLAKDLLLSSSLNICPSTRLMVFL